MTPRTLAKRIADSMLSKKGTDIAILDLRTMAGPADYFVLCTADSDVQVRAIADTVEEATGKDSEHPWHTEGRRAGIWVVLDYVDVVAHVFHREARSFYNLERLWADGKITHVRDTPRKKKAAGVRAKAPARKRKTA